MAVNLVEQFGRHRSRELLETSFAQFQADKSVVGISRQVQRNEEGLEGYKESMTCHLGDFEEYARLRRELKDRETELAKQGAAQRRARGRRRAGEAQAGRRHPRPDRQVRRARAGARPRAARGPVQRPPGLRARTTARARWC